MEAARAELEPMSAACCSDIGRALIQGANMALLWALYGRSGSPGKAIAYIMQHQTPPVCPCESCGTTKTCPKEDAPAEG